MSGERLQTTYSEQDLIGNETHVERYCFSWTVKDFVTRIRINEPQSLGTLVFHASERDECFTSWLIELNSLPNERGECIVEFSLSRLNSQNSSNIVFVRFFGEVQYNGTSKRFPLGIHANFAVGDKISQTLIRTHSSPNSNYYFSPNGYLHIECELTVFENQVEGYISPKIREVTPDGLEELSSDMDRLCRSNAYAHISLSINSKISLCYKAILSPRSCVLTEWMKNAVKGSCPRIKSPICNDELDAFLKHIYSGIMDIYLKHTIPTGLKESIEELKLSDLQEYIDFVCQQNIAKLRTIDVTWKIPFKKCLKSKFNKVHCPLKQTEPFDRKWQFQLTFSNNEKYLGIFVLRNADKSSIEFVKFVVKVIREEEVMFEKCSYLHFEDKNFQGMPNFITKRQILRFLSEKSLVLKCSLEILEPTAAMSRSEDDYRLVSIATESFKRGSIKNMQSLSESFKQLFESRIFSDAVIETIGQNFRIHSCILSVRLLTLVSNWKSYHKNIDPAFVESFIHYLFIYNMPKRKISDIIHNNITMDTKLSSDRMNPIQKILEFLPQNRIFTQYPAIDANRDEQVVRNCATSQNSYLDNIENVSSEENEDCESSNIHDDNSTNAGDREKQAVIENLTTLHPSYAYNEQYPALNANRDEQLVRNGATSQNSYLDNIENVSTKENEDSESSNIHDDISTNSRDRDEQAVFENCISLHPSYVYNVQYPARDGNRDKIDRNGATSQHSYLDNIENVSTEENGDCGNSKVHNDNSINEGYREEETQTTLLPSYAYDEEYPTIDAYGDTQVVKNGATSQKSNFEDGENVSSVQNENNGSFKISDYYSKSAEDSGKQAIVETPLTWHPSRTYGQYETNFPTNFGYYTMIGNHFVMYPQPAFGKQFTPDHNTPVNASFILSKNSNKEYESPATKSYSEYNDVTNTLLQHPSLVNTGNYCTALNENNQVSIPMTFPQFTNTNYHYNICKPQYASNQIINQNYQPNYGSFYQPNYQSFYRPNYQWLYPHSINGENTSYMPYNNAQASLSTVENSYGAPCGYYPMNKGQSEMFYPSYVNIKNLPFDHNAYYETSGIQDSWSSADAFQPAFQTN